MALKAGRVGVAPDQVDDFGKVKSDATSGYTKQEADIKFETKTAASEALALKQPKTLEVPLEMLSGSKLTVEDALQGLTDMVNVESLTLHLIPTDKAIILKNNSGRCGNVVNIRIQLHVTAEIANNTEIFRLDGLPHTGYGIAILGDTNEGTIIPLVVPTSNDNFSMSCRKSIPVGYYAISYSYIQ